MACFVVPAVEAIVVTVVRKVMEKNEKTNLLWGGSALLAFEHVWHGEVVPWFPFLTAAADPADAAEMLHEMATVGVFMAVLVTLAWLGMLGVSALIEKRAMKAEAVKA